MFLCTGHFDNRGNLKNLLDFQWFQRHKFWYSVQISLLSLPILYFFPLQTVLDVAARCIASLSHFLIGERKNLLILLLRLCIRTTNESNRSDLCIPSIDRVNTSRTFCHSRPLSPQLLIRALDPTDSKRRWFRKVDRCVKHISQVRTRNEHWLWSTLGALSIHNYSALMENPEYFRTFWG